MKGDFVATKYYDGSLPYRRLMCRMIEDAIRNATGFCISADGGYERCRNEVKKSAINYLMSEDFEHDMELLGLDEMIKSVRKYVFDDVNKTKSKIKIENEEK